MKKVISYNFENIVGDKTSWETFFTKERRDANFAAVFEVGPGEFLAVRDHLGTIPLYYKISDNLVHWSFNYNSLKPNRSNLKPENIQRYLGLASGKVTEIDSEIKIVPPGSVLRVNTQSVQNIYTYRMNTISSPNSRAEIRIELYKLLEKAVERTLKEDTIGLYLSGGMDSGLVGCILKSKDIKINAYTALPWGKNGTEYSFAKKNAEAIGAAKHTLIDVCPKKYAEYLKSLKDLYKTPNGSPTAINIAALWAESDISKENQLMFAQNTDTMSSSVSAQSNTIVTSFLPKVIRNKFVDMPHNSPVKNYLHHCTHGYVTKHPYEDYIDKDISITGQIAQAGMYIAHTPIDGESINGPSIANKKLCSNPYYDMDLIEFYIGIDSRQKISFNKESKTRISFEKNLFREVALNFLPKDLVYRKKGFTLPQERNKETSDFYENLDSKLMGIVAKSNYEKLSLRILKNHLS